MSDTMTASGSRASPVKKSLVKRKAAGVKAKASHPPTSIMVAAAIKELNEKKGSSLPAIKKYLAVNYKVDLVKWAPYIRKFLKTAVAKETIVQTKGTGASGYFKLAVAAVAKPKKKAAAPKKKLGVKKAKAPGSSKKKKSTTTKKTATTAKKPTSGEPATKKMKKAATPKPKVTKPKKMTPKKPAAAPKTKKIAAKKPTTAPKKK